MRFLLFLAVCLTLYYLIRAMWHRVPLKGRGPRSRQGPDPFTRTGKPPITDELVQDPICGVYCPKRDALPLMVQGRVHYFCSEACRQRFQREGPGA